MNPKYTNKISSLFLDPKFVGNIDDWEIYECYYYSFSKVTCLGAVNNYTQYDCWDIRTIDKYYKQWVSDSIKSRTGAVSRAYLKYYINKAQCPCKC